MAIECVDQLCVEAQEAKAALENAEVNLASWLANQQAALTSAQSDINAVLLQLAQYGSIFDCVVNGPVGTTCDTGSIVHLSIAEALDRLSLGTVTAVAVDQFTATADQEDFTLGAAAAISEMEVMVNGAVCRATIDYSVSGTTLSMVYGLREGDTVQVRRFVI